MMYVRRGIMVALLSSLLGSVGFAQAYGEPDSEAPGDRMIQEYLRREAEVISARSSAQWASRKLWEQNRAQRERDYFHMLGLWPLPAKTELHPTITGTYQGDGFVVDKLHFQSCPQLYVTANLYRPATDLAQASRPAVLYVCGHSHRGRDGNKTAYQSHGIWFARHGYVCLMLDTLQLGEIAAVHHGTYREQRWWWHSRGYTPAGVECWNGIRGIDYLVSRNDVDPARIAVTGISGGGAATFWIAAADPRVQVAVPVSGMADLPSYVNHRVINGHCDCMFMYNTYQWPWTQIAAMIAPRPLLFVNSDADAIFPMDANDRVINRLERVYSLYGAGDAVDAVVSIGGHAYREDIRRASFEFINRHLRQDVGPVQDSEVDLVTGPSDEPIHPIDPPQLRVFATDDDLPRDQRNTTIDEVFVPLGHVKIPKANEYVSTKTELLKQLRESTFRALPESVPPASVQDDDQKPWTLITEDVIAVELTQHVSPPQTQRVVLCVAQDDGEPRLPAWLSALCQADDAVFSIVPRGYGRSRWTRENPPNYVERAHVLLGRTVDTGRVTDVIAAAKLLRQRYPQTPVVVAGDQAAAVIAAYAALLDDETAGAVLRQPNATHMDPEAPQFLNVLRTCDIPDIIGMLAPKQVVLLADRGILTDKVRQFYEAAGAPTQLTIRAE